MANLQQHAIMITTGKLMLVVVAMFAFVFVVMVPLYDVLCDVLGINGKTSGARYEVVDAGIDESREIEIQFVTMNNEGMPWEFRPMDRIMRVNPGAANNTAFFASNPLAADMVAQAIPSVSPSRAAEFFHKTECFCFNRQPLAGGETAEMGLQFIIDKALPADIKTITLSYTLFDVTAMAQQEAVTAR